MMKRRIKVSRRMTFAACGLNAENNFLQAPICTCGCGKYMNIVLKTDQELYDFIGTMLSEYECECCAIFVIGKDGNGIIATKIDGKISIYGVESNGCSMKKAIADIQNDVQFHCYGLLEQIDEKSYKIVME